MPLDGLTLALVLVALLILGALLKAIVNFR